MNVQGLGAVWAGMNLHLWKVEAQATISLRLGLHWAAGLTPILEMVVPSAMHALGPYLLLMLHQAKKGSQLSLWLRITCADDGKHLVHLLQRAAHNMLPSH